MHHSEMDRLWTIWQGDNQTRLHDFEANTKSAIPNFPVPAMLNFNGTKTDNETMLWMGEFPPSVPMGMVWDTQDRENKGLICYRYDS